VSEASKSGRRHFDVALLTNHAEGMSYKELVMYVSERGVRVTVIGGPE
jgi:hypothetical protein